MKHVIFLDPIEKLSPEKDSTLQLALSMKERGMDVALLFEKDFYINNQNIPEYEVYSFSGNFKDGGPYLSQFELENKESWAVDNKTTLHMRIDPPFDTRYLRYLWMQRFLKESVGTKVLNDPDGVALFNEKLAAYSSEASLPSYVGSSEKGFNKFVDDLVKDNHKFAILKPLDLYQGIGVEKISLEGPRNDLLKHFNEKCLEYNGPVVLQPYDAKVESGEVRANYFKGKELGSIIKTPPKGEFLANIAQGATYEAYKLTNAERKACEDFCKVLEPYGVDWIAFDILGGNIQEVNITCPGLLVEVSSALGKNLALDIIDML